RADATLSDELSFKAACAMVELAVASPPPIQYPYTLPAEARDRNPEHLHEAPYWERNPNTGAWTRQVGTGQAGNDRHMQFETEPASAERAEELDHQARAMLDANTKKMPATMAVEFQREYAHRGWSQYGPVPTAVQNALEHPGRIAGQDNKLYERNAEGQWIHNRLLLRNQQAGGSLHEALEVTYQTQQRAMQPVTMAEPVTVRPTLEEWREAGLSDADFPYDMPLPDAPEHQIERASLSQREAYAQSLSEANRQGLDRQAAEQMASARTIPQGLSEVALEKATPAMKPPQRAESIIAGAAPITAVAMQAARHAAILERQTATIIPSPAETVREETSPSVSVTVTATDDMEEQEPRLRNHDFEQHRMDAPDLGKQRLPPDNSERMDAERAARAFQSPQEGPVGRTDHRDTGNVVNGPAHTPATMEKDASEFRFERQRDPAPPPIPDEVPVQHRSVDLQHENGDHDPGLRVSGSPIDGMKEQAGLGGDRETKDTRDGFDTSSDMDSRIVQENAPLSAMTFGRPMADSGKKDKIEENPVPRVSESVAQPSPSPRFEPPIPDEPEAEVTERELARRDHYQIPEDYKPTGHVQFDMLYEAIAFGNEADVDRVRVALRDCEAGDRSVAEVAARVDAIKEATMKQEMEQTQQQVELHGMDMAAQHGPVMVMTLRRPGGAPEGDSGSDGDGGGGGGG
ncbi:MAG: hypothetical protein LBL59_02890, partial [Xanthomonadaceae bacterium]|nr:hypothetical protein [Xanthomonadaceae bacterium]